ncbi:MAG: hypothetical protein EBZ48_07485 [Proteobacteria bacterium]|nr:hypothetical protein [Pseudomonadota bacterium]
MSVAARYSDLQSNIAQSVAQRLLTCEPSDLAGISLKDYKGLSPEWHSWERVRGICTSFGKIFAEALILS